MDFEFSAGNENPPSGMYKGTFSRVESREKNEHGESVRFVWKITEGECMDREATRICGIDRPPSAKNALGKMLAGLAGKSFEIGEKVSPDDFVGRPYLLQIADAPGGNGTRVETVMSAS